MKESHIRATKTEHLTSIFRLFFYLKYFFHKTPPTMLSIKKTTAATKR